MPLRHDTTKPLQWRPSARDLRRHEVDFEGSALRIEIHASDETVEIFVEADTNELPEERRRLPARNSSR